MRNRPWGKLVAKKITPIIPVWQWKYQLMDAGEGVVGFVSVTADLVSYVYTTVSCKTKIIFGEDIYLFLAHYSSMLAVFSLFV